MPKILQAGTDDAYIITNPSNIFYLTDYLADFACVAAVKGRLYYLSDSRFTIEAGAKLGKSVEFIETSGAEYVEVMKKLVPKDVKRVYIDKSCSYYECTRILDAFNGFEVLDASDEIVEMRRTKTDEEISRIVKAQRIAENALDELKPFIKEGVSERELKMRLEYLMGVGGSEKPSFDTIVAFGENSACAHAKPGDRQLKFGDFALFDFGATYRGYCSDMTRTFVFGGATERQADVYNAVLAAQKKAIREVAPGVSARDVDKAARDELTARSYGGYFTHSTGHGVGIDIHESPSLSPKSRDVLKRAEVVTIEPGIYIEGFGGVRIEDMIAVGFGDLTEYPKELEILH